MGGDYGGCAVAMSLSRFFGMLPMIFGLCWDLEAKIKEAVSRLFGTSALVALARYQADEMARMEEMVRVAYFADCVRSWLGLPTAGTSGLPLLVRRALVGMDLMAVPGMEVVESVAADGDQVTKV